MSEWIEMQPAPIRVKASDSPGLVMVEHADGTMRPWAVGVFKNIYGIDPPEPPPVTVTVGLTERQAQMVVLLWGGGRDDAVGGAAGEACIKLAAAIREQREATDGE